VTQEEALDLARRISLEEGMAEEIAAALQRAYSAGLRDGQGETLEAAIFAREGVLPYEDRYPKS
jgi:hypothetical protein